MDILNIALFWAHMMALALGGVASFGIPLMLRRMASDVAARPALMPMVEQMSKVGSAAIGTLILTGGILIFTKYDGLGGMTLAFWVKMALVVAMMAVIAVNRRLGARARAGDREAAGQARQMARVAMALLAAVVLAAVLAFG